MKRPGSRTHGGQAAFAGMLASLLFVVGCGSDVVERYPVEGTVTLDGQPIESGFIRFVQDQEAVGGAPVLDGKFQLKGTAGLPPGSYRVEVEGYRASPPPTVTGTPPPEADITNPAAAGTQFVPEKFNTQSTLTLDVPAGGTQQANFELKSN